MYIAGNGILNPAVSVPIGNFYDQRTAAVQFQIIHKCRALLHQLFRHQHNADVLALYGGKERRFGLLALMHYHAVNTRHAHTDTGIHIITNQKELHTAASYRISIMMAMSSP